MSRTFDLIAAGALSGQFEAGEVPGGIAGIFEGMAGVPWRRPGGGMGDGGQGQLQDDGYVACPQCHKPITSYNLNRHVKMVHSTMERATCTLCNKQFKNKYSLATHVHRQHSEHAHGGQGGVQRQPPHQHHHIYHQQTQRQTSQSAQPQPQLSSPQRPSHQQQTLPQRPHPAQNPEHPQQLSPQRPHQRQQQLQSSGAHSRAQATAILSPSQRSQPPRLQHHHHQRVPSPASGTTATVMQRPEELVQERH